MNFRKIDDQSVTYFVSLIYSIEPECHDEWSVGKDQPTLR